MLECAYMDNILAILAQKRIWICIDTMVLYGLDIGIDIDIDIDGMWKGLEQEFDLILILIIWYGMDDQRDWKGL